VRSIHVAIIATTAPECNRHDLGRRSLLHNRRAYRSVVRPLARKAVNRGKTIGTAQRGQITPEELQDMMVGGQELATLEGSLGGTV